MRLQVTTIEVPAGVRCSAKGELEDVLEFQRNALAEGAKILEFQDGARLPQRPDGLIEPSACVALYQHQAND